MKTPTLREKVEKYEAFLHKINMGLLCRNSTCIEELIKNADAWSYAHRQGNGTLSDKEQQSLIDSKFHQLCDTPRSDEEIALLKKKRKEALDKLSNQGQKLKMGY